MYANVIFVGHVSKPKTSFHALIFQIGTTFHSYTYSFAAKNKPISDATGFKYTEQEFIDKVHKHIPKHIWEIFFGRRPSEGVEFQEYQNLTQKLFPPKTPSPRPTFDSNIAHWRSLCRS